MGKNVNQDTIPVYWDKTNPMGKNVNQDTIPVYWQKN